MVSCGSNLGTGSSLHTLQQNIVQGQEGLWAIIVLPWLLSSLGCRLASVLLPAAPGCQDFALECSAAQLQAGALAVHHQVQRLVHQRVQVLHLAAVDTGCALDEERSCVAHPPG